MIGIFDSGVGGMTVAHAVEQALPEFRLVYFGDLARTPYGSKSPETITAYARQNIEFLIEKGAKLIVIACNSAASVAAEQMRSHFDLPIFDVISPAVDRVRTLSACPEKKTRIGVIGTRATVKSGVYPRLISDICPNAEIISQECPLLVPLVEEGWLNKRETKMILRRYLTPLKRKQVNALVLGCTHYPLLKSLIQPRVGKRVTIIDSSKELAANLKTYLADNPDLANQLSSQGENCYYVSDITEAATKTAKRIFGREISLIKT
jgi:glutamate racemase